MKNQLSKSNRRFILQTTFLLTLIIFVPIVFFVNGFLFYLLYSGINLLAVLPALTFTDCLIITLPLAILDYIFVFIPQFNEFRSVSKLRMLIREKMTY